MSLRNRRPLRPSDDKGATKIGAAKLLAVVAGLVTDGHKGIAHDRIVTAAREQRLSSWCERYARYLPGIVGGDPDRVVEEFLGEFELRAGHWRPPWVVDLARETLTRPARVHGVIRSRFLGEGDASDDIWHRPGERMAGVKFGAEGAVELIRQLGGPKLSVAKLLAWGEVEETAKAGNPAGLPSVKALIDFLMTIADGKKTETELKQLAEEQFGIADGIPHKSRWRPAYYALPKERRHPRGSLKASASQSDK